MTGHSERIQGIDLYCHFAGAGRPLLLLHGFTGCGEDWKYVFAEPPAGYRLIAPDLRGHGRSSGATGEFTFRQCSVDILELLDRLGVSGCQAIGVSGGGQVLLHMAVREPFRIDSQVLVSTAHYFPEPARKLMRLMTVDSRSEQEWFLMRQRHRRGDEQIRALWRHGNALQYSYDDVNFSPEALAAIRARTLIVHGDRDPLYSLEIAFSLRDSIPGARLLLIQEGGHGPIFGEQAPYFVECALSFLAEDLAASPQEP